jgi:hypothetical protein
VPRPAADGYWITHRRVQLHADVLDDREVEQDAGLVSRADHADGESGDQRATGAGQGRRAARLGDRGDGRDRGVEPGADVERVDVLRARRVRERRGGEWNLRDRHALRLELGLLRELGKRVPDAPCVPHAVGVRRVVHDRDHDRLTGAVQELRVEREQLEVDGRLDVRGQIVRVGRPRPEQERDDEDRYDERADTHVRKYVVGTARRSSHSIALLTHIGFCPTLHGSPRHDHASTERARRICRHRPRADYSGHVAGATNFFWPFSSTHVR